MHVDQVYSLGGIQQSTVHPPWAKTNALEKGCGWATKVKMQLYAQIILICHMGYHCLANQTFTVYALQCQPKTTLQ